MKAITKPLPINKTLSEWSSDFYTAESRSRKKSNATFERLKALNFHYALRRAE